MDRDEARRKIRSIFSKYRSLRPSDATLLQKLKDGKLYELFVLSELLKELAARGFTMNFIGHTLKFKGAPGQLNMADPHFEVVAPDGTMLWLFVDIEFETLGSAHCGTPDRSHQHELDIVLVTATPPNPTYAQIALAVECKCVAKFEKKLIKEVLGVRRELSYVRNAQPSVLAQHGGGRVAVPADPPSEFWLAHIDASGRHYRCSPSFFGVELRHIEP